TCVAELNPVYGEKFAFRHDFAGTELDGARCGLRRAWSAPTGEGGDDVWSGHHQIPRVRTRETGGSGLRETSCSGALQLNQGRRRGPRGTSHGPWSSAIVRAP